MIKLYCFPPAFLLPSPGPFAIKTEVHLKMIGLDYERCFQGVVDAPQGKLPWIDDEGEIVADSTFVRRYLERRYDTDLDAGFDATQQASAWSVERLVEDQLYWTMVHMRWAVDENFEKGPARFFDKLPKDIQDEVRQKQRNAALGYLHGQGMGRHTQGEITEIAEIGYQALSQLLARKPFLLGDKPCGVDASIFGQIASLLTPFFDSPVRDAATRHPNLVAYADRMMMSDFPDYAN